MFRFSLRKGKNTDNNCQKLIEIKDKKIFQLEEESKQLKNTNTKLLLSLENIVKIILKPHVSYIEYVGYIENEFSFLLVTEPKHGGLIELEVYDLNFNLIAYASLFMKNENFELNNVDVCSDRFIALANVLLKKIEQKAKMKNKKFLSGTLKMDERTKQIFIQNNFSLTHVIDNSYSIFKTLTEVDCKLPA